MKKEKLMLMILLHSFNLFRVMLRFFFFVRHVTRHPAVVDFLGRIFATKYFINIQTIVLFTHAYEFRKFSCGDAIRKCYRHKIWHMHIFTNGKLLYLLNYRVLIQLMIQ